jgi:hypothetical protein
MPAHVPPDMAHVPVFRAEHVVCSSTGKAATSFLPAVLARLSDLASANQPGKTSANLTDEQWQVVSTWSWPWLSHDIVCTAWCSDCPGWGLCRCFVNSHKRELQSAIMAGIVVGMGMNMNQINTTRLFVLENMLPGSLCPYPH